MPLSRSDQLDLLRYFLALLEQADSALYEKVVPNLNIDTDRPRDSLLSVTNILIELLGVRTVSAHDRVIERLNSSITTETGNPVAGVRISLSDSEQSLYQRDELDLAPVMGTGEFIAGLREVMEDVRRESEDSND